MESKWVTSKKQGVSKHNLMRKRKKVIAVEII